MARQLLKNGIGSIGVKGGWRAAMGCSGRRDIYAPSSGAAGSPVWLGDCHVHLPPVALVPLRTWHLLPHLPPPGEKGPPVSPARGR